MYLDINSVIFGAFVGAEIVILSFQIASFLVSKKNKGKNENKKK